MNLYIGARGWWADYLDARRGRDYMIFLDMRAQGLF